MMKAVKWSPERMQELLEQIQGRKILVVGDVGVDRYTIGSVDRVSPEAPVPIVFVQDEKHKLGLAANVADNVRTLGGEARMVGVVGKDAGAKLLKGLFKKARISSSHLVEDSSRRTVLKERIVSEHQQLLRVDYESIHPLTAKAEKTLIKKIYEQVALCDAVILEDYAKGMITQAVSQAVFKAAKKYKKWVAVDPNLKTPIEEYQGASMLTPNTKEAEHLSGLKIRDDRSLLEAGQVILRKTQAKNLVITRGKDGMAIFTKGKKGCELIPTYAQEVFDVSGAGDTVIATLTMAMAAGASVAEAAVLGNLAAGVEVSKRGTATVSPDEVMAAIEVHRLSEAGGWLDHADRHEH